MDMKQFRQHLANVSAQKTVLSESEASSSAQKLARSLDEFEKAAKNLLAEWDDAIDIVNNDDVTTPDGYPFEESFDEVVQKITKFTAKFKATLRTVK